MITTEPLTRSGDSGPAGRARSVLVAEASDESRKFLAENVPRTFSVFCAQAGYVHEAVDLS
jgi:hypothetical protein